MSDERKASFGRGIAGAPRDLDLKYRLALKAIGIGPKDKIYKAMQMFLPIVGLAKIKEVTVVCDSEEEYMKALDALAVSKESRHAGSILKPITKVAFDEVTVNVEMARKPSAWKGILR